MEDVIEGPGEIDVGGDVVVDELEVGAGAQMGDVVEVAGEEIIHGNDAVSFGQETIAEVRSKETGAAGDEGGRLSGGCFH